HRARGAENLRLRRRAVGPGPGALLLPPGGPHRPRHGLGYPLSARLRVGILPRPATRGRRPQSRHVGRPLSMGRYVFKLPDVGEGTAEAELVGWHVQVGDTVAEDQVVADVMTDKATVEITSPVAGVVTALHGEPGQMMAVRGPLAEFEVEGEGNVAADEPAPAPVAAKAEAAPVVAE